MKWDGSRPRCCWTCSTAKSRPRGRAIWASRGWRGRAPRVSEALLQRAVALHRAGRLAEAAAAYRQGLATAPGDAAAWSNLSSLLAGLGQVAEAVAAGAEAG